MTLSAGSRFGPYEVLSSLASGGMGEVYRARDTRLRRDVALKIIASESEASADRRRRFEDEAQAAGALNHPNVLSVFDVGFDGDTPYVVFELLEGETLRERLQRGPLPVRSGVDYAIQVCRGLAAAHGKGIVHRDLKPENLFLTGDGRVKILDFGLAKLTQGVDGEAVSPSEHRTATTPGLLLGTVAYMSPEQARGQPADARSDLFALGATLYEMLSGRRAFAGASPADTLAAILGRDPEPIGSPSDRAVPATLAQIVRRCLEKDPEERFQSARDLAIALEVFCGVARSVEPETVPIRHRHRSRWLVGAGLVVILAAAFGLGATKRPWPPRLPTFSKLTFRRGTILSAFFTSDAKTVVYSATWDGEPPEIFSMRIEAPESRSLGLPPARLLAVSSKGELAILLTPPGDASGFGSGTLARVPLGGGAPREVLQDVYSADWSPDGNELAIVRRVAGELQLEYPIGRILKRPVSAAEIPFVRVAPRGDRLALNDGGRVVVIDGVGEETSFPLGAVWGLAWSPDGDSVWADSFRGGSEGNFWALTPGRAPREVFRAAGVVRVHDISRAGQLLIHHGLESSGVMLRARGDTRERDVGVFDMARIADMNADGTQVVLLDRGPTVSFGSSSAFLRTKAGPPVRLGDGQPCALSPDGKWVLLREMWTSGSSWNELRRLLIVPTGPGVPRELAVGSLEKVRCQPFAGTGRVLIDAAERGRPSRTYAIDLQGGAPRPVTPEGVLALWDSHRGDTVIGRASDGALARYSLTGAEPEPIPVALPDGFEAIRASADGASLLIHGGGAVPVHVERLDLTTGERTPWKTLRPEDPAGVTLIRSIRISSDEQAYGYRYGRYLQDLYLVEGLR